MSKRARRLWLGDWQRGESDEGDTFVVLPDDEGDAEPREEKPRNARRALVTGALIAAACALVLALLSRGNDNNQTPAAESQVPPTQTSQSQPQPQLPQTPQVPQGAAPGGFGGPDLTGPAATKAAKAALGKFPGGIERVTAGPGGGGYVVHVIQGDGCEVHVVVSGQFKVLGSDAGANGCGSGGGVTPYAPAPQGGSAGQS